MIRGTVTARNEAVVRVRVGGPNDVSAELDVLVDTGCSSSMLLPRETVSALGLKRHAKSKAVLADGSERRFDVYRADVEWNGHWQSIFVSSIGDEPVIGMRLLGGHRLVADVAPGGEVSIIPFEELP
jgi:clan AA aspartic protease